MAFEYRLSFTSRPTGLNAIDTEGIQVYPNPSNGDFNISLSNISEQASEKVFDIQGRIVYSQTKGLLLEKTMLFLLKPLRQVLTLSLFLQIKEGILNQLLLSND